ncbi:hypothetical protein LFM09_49670 [Lentzea alba]|uniref:hypothetical protein n=1 Tax=Lentzea alba TaxID=2714351 RepID=UPI0039BF19B7
MFDVAGVLSRVLCVEVFDGSGEFSVADVAAGVVVVELELDAVVLVATAGVPDESVATFGDDRVWVAATRGAGGGDCVDVEADSTVD